MGQIYHNSRGVNYNYWRKEWKTEMIIKVAIRWKDSIKARVIYSMEQKGRNTYELQLITGQAMKKKKKYVGRKKGAHKC